MRTPTLLACLLLVLPAISVQAAKLKGIEMPDTRAVEVRETRTTEVTEGKGRKTKAGKRAEQVTAKKELVLNGLGLRTKFGFKVYVGGLYLESRSQDPEAILASDGLKHIDMQFLRDVGTDKIRDQWKEVFPLYCKDDACKAEHQARFDQFLAMHGDVSKDDVISYTFHPARVEVFVQGERKGAIEGEEFPRLILSAWIGAHATDFDLKAGMLGKL